MTPPRTPLHRSPTTRLAFTITATVAGGVPWLVASALVVALLAEVLLGGGVWTLVVLGGWLLSGALAWWPQFETLLRWALGLGGPSAVDMQLLQSAWGAVTGKAGFDGTGYSLWIDGRQAQRADAVVGHLVAVPPEALLHTAWCEALLAREIERRTQHHPRASLLAYWYSIPGRLVIVAVRQAMLLADWFVRGTYRVTLRIVGAIFGMSSPIGLLVRGYIWLSFACMVGQLALILGPLLILPSGVAWSRRVDERRADRFAARLGYGPALIGFLQEYPTPEPEVVNQVERLLASRASTATRVRTLYR